MVQLFHLAACLLPLTFAAPSGEKRQLGPSVQLSYATVVGSSAGGVDSFKGIPYAQSPVGQLRLKPPQQIQSNLGTIQATGLPRACPQYILQVDKSNLAQSTVTQLLNTPIGQTAQDSGEDCLTLNVQRPSYANATTRLPVLFWIYGGAFQFGSTQTYDATQMILSSEAQGKDFIFVAVNYRVGGFGFLPGSKLLADGSSNLGLLDQRLGLQWVADNIAKFGGDPTKVTIWGESAGSVSIMHQMALYNGNNIYNGKPLFRAAIMDSGSLIPSDPMNCPKGEAVYNQVVQNAGCATATDTLACLRSVDYTTFLNAVNSLPGITSYSSIALSYQPRPDGTVLTNSIDTIVKNRQYTNVPFIIGDQEDEGTLFSLNQSNITTTDQLVDYIHTYLLQDATRTQVANFVALYPDDPSAGSPFRTGALNNIYPQYKRLAAIAGDITFNMQRRILLNLTSQLNPSTPSWSYLASYFYGTPVLGTFHASDIPPAFGETPGTIPSLTIQSYYLSFVNNLNPNIGAVGLPNWPQWSSGKQLMNFNLLSNSLIADNFRQTSSDYIAAQAPSFNF